MNRPSRHVAGLLTTRRWTSHDTSLRLLRRDGKNLAQRDHDKVALMHSRMRNGEFGCRKFQVAVQKQIDVDWPVVINAVFRLQFATHLTLNFLSLLEAFLWRKRRLNHHGSIQETVLAFETPRFCLDKRRNTLNRPHSLPDKSNRPTQVLSSVTKITS